MRRGLSVLFVVIAAVVSVVSAYGKITMIPAVGDTKCRGSLTASSYLVNTGQKIEIKVGGVSCADRIIGRETKHKRWAYYYFDGSACLIKVNGKEYGSHTVTTIFDEPRDYTVEAVVMFRWKLDPRKNNAGFQKYYTSRIVLTKVIRVSDLENESEPDQKDEADEEAKKPAVSAMIYHTDKWDENRNRFNTYCLSRGYNRRIRSANTFWSGEKFMLLAEANGEEQPHNIKVSIEEEGYQTILRYNGTAWEGSIFDSSMIGRWGRDGPQVLKFIFSAEIDGIYCTDSQSVVVDDRWPYMIMHRKE